MLKVNRSLQRKEEPNNVQIVVEGDGGGEGGGSDGGLA